MISRLIKKDLEEIKEGYCIDVGANTSQWTLSLRTSNSLPIIAFEPEPFLFEILSLILRSINCKKLQFSIKRVANKRVILNFVAVRTNLLLPLTLIWITEMKIIILSTSL